MLEGGFNVRAEQFEAKPKVWHDDYSVIIT